MPNVATGNTLEFAANVQVDIGPLQDCVAVVAMYPAGGPYTKCFAWHCVGGLVEGGQGFGALEAWLEANGNCDYVLTFGPLGGSEQGRKAFMGQATLAFLDKYNSITGHTVQGFVGPELRMSGNGNILNQTVLQGPLADIN